MRLLPAIILATALVLAPVVWFALSRIIPGGQTGGQGAGMAIDSGARNDIEMLNQQLGDLRDQVETLTASLQGLADRPAAPPGLAAASQESFGDQPMQPLEQDGPNAIVDAYAQVVLIADRLNVNRGLTIASPRFLEETFGLPRQDLNNECQSMTNPRLASLLKVQTVGPVRVQMVQPALDSLDVVLENVRAADPDLYARINTAGSLCVRLIRGSTSSASSHSYGLAVDLNIDGKLDTLGDGRTQLGLTILADFFLDEGWIWGAAWGREDSMHFEVSRDKLLEWISEGKI